MKYYKVLCFCLAVLMLSGTFTACADVGVSDETTLSQAETTAIANEETTKNLYDAEGFLLPTLDPNLNFGGEEVTVLAWDGQSYEEFDTETQNGELINDTLYTRNAKVEDTLGVHLEFVRTKGGSSDVDAYVFEVTNDVMAGSELYDLYAAYSRTIAMCAYSGLTEDLINVPHLDLDMPWWPESLTSQSIINNELYYCSGDLTISLFHNLPVIYFNKTIANENSISDEMLYSLVLDGKWTIDKMIELTAGSYKDENGDGIQGDEDRYGYMGQTTQVQPLFWGCGITAINVVDGEMKVSESYTGEKMHNLLGKILDWMYLSGNARYSSKGNNSFSEGKLLFFQNVASYTMTKFNLVPGLEFGILPCPKADENQENYASVMGNTVTLYAIPNDTKQAEMCGAVLECLGSEGYRKLSPAIYESSMKLKYAPDSTTAIMYDMIRASALFENGRIFSAVLDDIFTKTINDQLKNNSTDWMSTIAKIESQITAKMADLNDVFIRMD